MSACLSCPEMMVAQGSCRVVARWTWAWSVSTGNGLCRMTATSVGYLHSRSYSAPTSHSGIEPQWRYKTDRFVRKVAADVEAGRRTTTTTITLNTAHPVTPDLCHDVLMHLYRKVDALQICFRERDGELWVADMDTPIIDF